MMTSPNGANELDFFSYCGLYLIGLNLLGIILALFGIFYAAFFILYLIFGAVILAMHWKATGQKIRLSRYTLASVFLIVLFILANGYLSTPSVFSGRDQGSFSQAAIRLADNHRLNASFPAEAEFFKIYGPGRALNFPGFDYLENGQLVSQFPVGYTSWLAIFYSFFGLFGFILANSIAFLVFAMSFYFLARKYLREPWAFLTLLLVVTCFAFSWFARTTLSENLALMILWFGLLEFILFLKDRQKIHFIAFSFSFLVLAFTRLEAWIFIAVILVVLNALFRKNWAGLKKFAGKYELIALGAIILIYAYSIIFNPFLYLSAAKGLFLSLKDSAEATGALSPLASFHYVIRVFFSYAFLNYLVIAALAFAYFLLKKKYTLLIPFLVVLPAFAYILQPSITFDHPWMLRRYLFAVIPVSVLYTMIFIDYNFRNQVLKNAVFIVLLLSNLTTAYLFIGTRENTNLLRQTEELAYGFSPDDLVLVDRLATGTGWAMIPEPMNTLYGRQAVYFFNPEDARKLDREKWKNVFLVIPEESLGLYLNSPIGGRLTPIRDYQIANNFLDVATEEKETLINKPVVIPPEREIVTKGKIYQLK